MAASTLEIVAIKAFSDNYLWLAHDRFSGETAVIDPGDALPVLTEADRRGWRIGQVLNTHWHPDHTGGNQAVKAATGSRISGPAREEAKIAGIDVRLNEGDEVRIGSHRGEVWEVPGHTLGHIALVFRDAGLAFVGDTIFAMGCGRLFEGTPAQMYASLQRIAALPEDMLLYCAHEYTLSNALFAAAVEPDNHAVSARLVEVEQLRAAGRITVPTTVAAERATNPFLLAPDLETFTQRRELKDRS